VEEERRDEGLLLGRRDLGRNGNHVEFPYLFQGVDVSWRDLRQRRVPGAAEIVPIDRLSFPCSRGHCGQEEDIRQRYRSQIERFHPIASSRYIQEGDERAS